MITRPFFASQADYGARFTDPLFWQPYVAEICRRHGLPFGALHAGLPGTNAVFLVDQRYAVKLFPDLFGGAVSYPTERQCYDLIAQASQIPAPALIASGDLFDHSGGWHWPYLITSVLPGQSLGETPSVGFADRLNIASWLGQLLRRIHGLPLEGSGPLIADWNAYSAFLTEQRATVTNRQVARGVLPAHLCAQLEAYLPPAELLIDRASTPRLLHCDLNRDHVLGTWVAGRWQPSGVIDFGDARVGDPAYDLVALHLGLFDADKRLLQAFLHAYGAASLASALPHRAMSLTLLHEFTVIGQLQHVMDMTATLGELADLLWNLNPPGITATPD